MLFHDVRTHFRLMESRGWLTTVSRERLAQTAFVIACFHAIELDDAMSVALAVIRGDPLVVADESVYQTLRLLAEERPGLHVQWLPDYGRGT
jgi:hypothetical protein